MSAPSEPTQSLAQGRWWALCNISRMKDESVALHEDFFKPRLTFSYNCRFQMKIPFTLLFPSFDKITRTGFLTFASASSQLYSFTCLFLLLFFFLISWRLITLQYCSGVCHTLTWISHGFTCVPHPNPPSHLPLHTLPLGLPSAPGPTCLMHPAWAGDLFHPR